MDHSSPWLFGKQILTLKGKNNQLGLSCKSEFLPLGHSATI